MTKIQNPFTSKPESPIHSFASHNTHTTRTLHNLYIYNLKAQASVCPYKNNKLLYSTTAQEGYHHTSQWPEDQA